MDRSVAGFSNASVVVSILSVLLFAGCSDSPQPRVVGVNLPDNIYVGGSHELAFKLVNEGSSTDFNGVIDITLSGDPDLVAEIDQASDRWERAAAYPVGSTILYS